MKHQDRPFTCGPASLSNALHALGRRPPTLERLAKLCRTTVDGTTQGGMQIGVRAMGLAAVTVKEPEKCLRYLETGRPIVAAVRTVKPYDHWVAVVGRLGERVVLADSADYDLVRTMTWRAFLRIWDGPEGYYGLALV